MVGLDSTVVVDSKVGSCSSSSSEGGGGEEVEIEIERRRKNGGACLGGKKKCNENFGLGLMMEEFDIEVFDEVMG